MVNTYWAIRINFGKNEKQCKKTGCTRPVTAIFTGFLQGHLQAKTTRCASGATPFGKACFLRESSDYRSVRQYAGCWLQLPATFGHIPGITFSTYLRCFWPDFLIPSAFDWRVAFKQGAQQADL